MPLELVDAFGFGTAIATKSDLITRDIDILSEIKEHSPVLCKITVTQRRTPFLALVEPGVCPSSARFEAVRRLSEAGIFAGILLMPVLPFLEDNKENITAIVRKAHEAGARFIYAEFGMTLEQKGEYGSGDGRYAYLSATKDLKVLIELLESDKK